MANLKEQLAHKLASIDVALVDTKLETEESIMAKDSDNQVIQLRPQADNLTAPIDTAPHFVVTLVEAKNRVQQLQQFVTEFMKPGVDFGMAPGTDKPTLLKPGAEKLCEIYGFSKIVEIVTQKEDWELPLFAYIVKVRLVNKRTGFPEAEGVGAANSREKKYSKQDAFSIQNTLLKMAKKRALVDAVLSATRSSGMFTQDIEDFDMPQPSPTTSSPLASGAQTKVFNSPAIVQKPYSSEVSAPTTGKPAMPIHSVTPKVVTPTIMTPKQRNLILSLIGQKKLGSDTVEAMLSQKFGHNDGGNLSKSEASQFITALLA